MSTKSQIQIQPTQIDEPVQNLGTEEIVWFGDWLFAKEETHTHNERQSSEEEVGPVCKIWNFTKLDFNIVQFADISTQISVQSDKF